jgi:hypothetical protein
MLDIKDFSVLKTKLALTLRVVNKKVTGNGFSKFNYHHRLSGQYSQRKVYSMETLISVKEESNPLFTSNTSLVLTGWNF